MNEVFDWKEGRRAPDFRVGNWVTVQHGLYKNDLAVIRHVLEGDGLGLAVVPRIGINTPSRSTRPEKKLAFADVLERQYPNNQVIRISENAFSFRGERYVDHLRMLTVPGLHSVKKASPTLEDVFYFAHTDLGELELIEPFLRRFDVVVVTQGQYQSMAGTVSSIDDEFCVLAQSCRVDKFVRASVEQGNRKALQCLVSRSQVRHIQDTSPDLPEITVSRKEIRRLLSMGDHVVVKVGPRKGTKGIIMSIDNKSISLYVSDSNDFVSLSFHTILL